MPAYDAAHFDPPAPVARVTLRNPTNNALIPNVMLLIDTGADITLLPRAVVEKLGVRPIDDAEFELQGFDGTKSTAVCVELDVIFLKKAYRGTCLLIDDDCGVLGRDVLSSVALLFDGPAQMWSQILTNNPMP